MKFLLLAVATVANLSAVAQNIGIGTATPQTKLHVFNAGSSVIRAETNAGSTEAGLELKTNGGGLDFLELRKWMPGSSGTIAGIALDGLSQITTGVGTTGGLMVGTKTAQPIYFTTSNTERLRINPDGRLLIGPAASTTYGKINIFPTGTELSIWASNLTNSGTVYGIVSTINAPNGAAIGATTYTNLVTSTFEAGRYALMGQAGDGGIAVGAFVTNGTALRASLTSGTGLALSTSGPVKMDGISEGLGKVLTSDATGNATWQTLPTGAGAWTVSGNNIYNNNTGYVGIKTATPLARLHINNPTSDSVALLITHPGSRITRINGNRELYHEGDLWVHSAWGIMRFGYADKGWYWGTINGGQDLQLWSHSTPDLSGSRVNRMYLDGSTGNIGINTNNSPAVNGKLIVDRNADMNGLLGGYFGVVTGLNSSATDGSGVYGISYAPRTGAQSYAGVSGYNPSNSTDRFGVIGTSAGTTSGSVYSAGVGGYGDYGVLGYSSSNTGAGMIAQHSAGKTALEINNGFIKVSGSAGNKTAFRHTTSVGNTSGHITTLSYTGAASTDILIVTHDYNGTYITKTFGTWWNGAAWTIYMEDTSAMPVGEIFNVLVIKQ